MKDLEINFTRLLNCTEDLVSGHDFNKSRYQDYSQTLDQYLYQLTSSESKPDAETLRHYELRLKKLKSSHNIQSLDIYGDPRLPNLHQMVNSKTDDLHNSLEDISALRSSSNSADATDSNVSSPNDHNLADVMNSVEIKTCITDSRDLILEERRRINRELREQLLSDGRSSKSGYAGSSEDKITASSTHLLRSEEVHRERLASEMLGFVNDLKNQSNVMSQRLRSDCVTLDNSIEHAGRNTNELKKIQSQLEVELGSRCGCVVWILFIVTIFLFFEMIFFMKLFRKRVFSSRSHPTVNDEL